MFTTIERNDHTLVPLATLSGMSNIDNIDRFFTENRANQKLFFQGIGAIVTRDNSFFDHPIKLPLLNEISVEEFESKWEQLIPLLRPSDSIMTFDMRSIVSRAITVLDHGVWSHTACYIGNGQIIEATVSGWLNDPSIPIGRDNIVSVCIKRTPTMGIQKKLQNILHLCDRKWGSLTTIATRSWLASVRF